MSTDKVDEDSTNGAEPVILKVSVVNVYIDYFGLTSFAYVSVISRLFFGNVLNCKHACRPHAEYQFFNLFFCCLHKLVLKRCEMCSGGFRTP